MSLKLLNTEPIEFSWDLETWVNTNGGNVLAAEAPVLTTDLPYDSFYLRYTPTDLVEEAREHSNHIVQVSYGMWFCPSTKPCEKDDAGDLKTAALFPTIDPETTSVTVNEDGVTSFTPGGVQDYCLDNATWVVEGLDWVYEENNQVKVDPPSNHCADDDALIVWTFVNGYEAEQVVDININCINDAPYADNVYLYSSEDINKTFDLNGWDVDNDDGALTYSITSNPSNGTISSGSGKTRTYTPNANFHGIDSFTYTVSDGSLTSNTATVTIEVSSVNDQPTASGQSSAQPKNSL